ncbi:MAG: ABC transporter ATP-binding protein [Candidatus Hodarchaeales archaeon]|jgi:ABC-type lipoprotein export system ATPase subunit
MSDTLIECEELYKIFKQGSQNVVAISELNLVIKKGEFSSIIGKSGSGKSTLLALIAGILKPTAGRILYKGKDISKSLISTSKRKICIIPQRGDLIPELTIEENLRLSGLLAGLEIRQIKLQSQDLLSSFDLLHRRHFYPRNLSGGEQKRASIAITIMKNPDIILADEPTGELHYTDAVKVISIFKQLNERDNKTILIVTHDPLFLKYTEHTWFLSDGKIIGERLGLSPPLERHDEVDYVIMNSKGMLNLPKSIREIIRPTNKFIVKFDKKTKIISLVPYPEINNR